MPAMEDIMAILRMISVDYLNAEMNCGWCVFVVDGQRKRNGQLQLVFASKVKSFLLTPATF